MDNGSEMKKKYPRKMVIILSVVITIILLATYLYLSQGYYTNDGLPVEGTSFQEITTNSTEAKIIFNQIIGDNRPMNFKFIVYENNSEAGQIYWISDTETDWFDSDENKSATYFDYNPKTREINAGDYVVLNGLKPDTNYRVVLMHVPSDCAVPGGEAEFHTNP